MTDFVPLFSDTHCKRIQYKQSPMLMTVLVKQLTVLKQSDPRDPFWNTCFVLELPVLCFGTVACAAISPELFCEEESNRTSSTSVPAVMARRAVADVGSC